jgi:hypothetical protein
LAAHLVEHVVSTVVNETCEELLGVPEQDRPGDDLSGVVQRTEPGDEAAAHEQQTKHSGQRSGREFEYG